MESNYESMTLSPIIWVSELARFIGVFPGEATFLPKHADASWQLLKLFAQREGNVTVNDTTHTAYVYPGAHLQFLLKDTLVRLY